MLTFRAGSACRIALSLTLGLLSTLVLISVAPPAEAAVINSFDKVFSAQTNGSIGITGNSLLTCSPSATCTTALAGTSNNGNNDFTMVKLDTDSNASTTSSSMAHLTVPTGGTVLFAGLYWGAGVTAGNNGTAAPANGDRSLLFRTPGSGSYTKLVPQVLDKLTTNANDYSAFYDVTSIVKTAGSGDYWGADIQAGTGVDRYGAWSLVVAFGDPTAPLRDLSVFNGYATVSGTATVSASISGFLTPPTGTVRAKVGMVTYEGDQQLTGDYFQVNSTQLSDAGSPSTNFFNSRITADGNNLTDRNPANPNNLGVDAKVVDASGAIPNGATSASLRFGTNGDVYYPAVLTTQVDLYAPTINGTKTVNNVSGNDPAKVGDTLEYTISYSNTGDDTATNAVLLDTLPANVTYVPGSLKVTAGANVGTKTDATDTDQGEYVGASRLVRVRVGTGANGTTGGSLVKGASTTVTFRVTIDASGAGTTISNKSQLDYKALTIGQTYTYDTAAVVNPVGERADLAITKGGAPNPVSAGSNLTYTLNVTNNGPNPAQGATVSDVLPGNVTFVSATAPQGTCTHASGTVSCALGTIPNGTTVPVTIVVKVDPAFDGSGLANVATVNATTSDPNTANNSAATTTATVRSADLQITKTAAPASPVPGSQVTYTLTATNNGPSDATSVVVADQLPTQLLAPTATTTGGTCSVNGRDVSCTLAGLGAGATVTITVKGTLNPALTTTTAIPNTATISSQTPDPSATNNSSTASITPVAPSADLRVTKATNTSPVVAGSPVSYTVTVTNAGPSAAVGVQLTENPPAGLGSVTVNPSQGTCALLVCTLGTIAPGSSATVAVTGVVAATASGNLTNSATVTSTTTDPTPGNNTGTVTDTLASRADVSISKTASPSPVLAGNQVTYTLTAHNNGPSVARNVVVSDPVPSALTFVSATPAACTYSAGTRTVTCPIGDLAVGADAVVTVVANTPADGSGNGAVNTATVSTTSTDPNPGDNTASYTLSSAAQANLVMTKTQTPATVIAGQTVQWTLTTHNSGPSAASTVTVTDTLPSGLTGVSVTPAGQCSLTGGVNLSCTRPTLNSGGDFVVTINATVSASQNAGPLSNTATATAATPPDPTQADNTDTSTGTVVTQANLGLTKTGPATVTAGNQATYTLTVSNAGPSDARDVVITDQLPAGTTFVPDGGSPCVLQAGSTTTVTCPVGTVAPGATPSVTVKVQVGSGVAAGTLTNTAVVGSSTPDPTPANNTASATTTVNNRADLSIAKTVDLNPLAAGLDANYTLTVHNNGPSDATTVAATDTLPPGVTFVSATTAAGSCTQAAGLVTCTRPVLAAGADWTITVRVHVAPGTTAAQQNQAAVTSATTDPTAGNNATSITTPVTAAGDLEVVKTAMPTPVVPGQQVTYILTVVNYGPATMTGVTVSDPLAAALTSVTVDASQGTCSFAAGIASCDLGSVAPSAPQTVTIKATLAPGYPNATLGNTATVTSTTRDLHPDNDSDTVSTAVAPSADLTLTKETAEDPAVPGRPYDYLLTLTNRGPSTARGVTITDTMPAGLTALSATWGPAATPCAVTATLVTCTVGVLDPGQVTATVRVRLDASYAGTSVTNTASATASTPDPNPADNNGSATTPVAGRADLAIQKTRTSAGPVVPGQPITWRLRVTNTAGPSTARGVTVTDTLPADVSGVTASAPTGTTCTVTTTSVSCTLPDLAVGDVVDIDVTGTLAATATAQVINSATVGSTTADPDSSNNTGSASDTPQAAANVSIVKTRTSGAIVPGQPVTWQLVVANAGPSTARNVTVNDDLVDAITGLTATAPCTVAAGNVVACALGDLAPGGSVTLTVSGGVPAGYTGPLDNTATVTSPTDTTPGNNTSTSTGTAAPAADVSIAKTRTSGPVVPGQPVTWQIVVANAGPSTARNVTVDDDVADELTGLTATAPCTIAAGNVVACALGDLAPGASVTLTVSGGVPAGYTGPLANTATVTSPTDTTPGNNSSTNTGTAAPAADVSIAKTRPSGAVVPGQPVTWQIVVANAGPSTARNVTVDDDVADELTGLTATAPCTIAAGNVVACALGDLAPGASVTLTVSGGVPAGYTGPLANTATVTSPTDTTPGNNTSTSTGTAVPDADVSVTKTRPSGPVVPGQPVTWSIVVANTGPSVARSVNVNDDVDDAITGLTATAPCTIAAGNVVSCALGDLAPGDSVTLTVSGGVPAGFTGPLANTATVTSPTDTTPGNNSATSTGGAQAAADVSVTKTRTSGPVVPGQPVTWQIVVANGGPSTARSVTVDDDADDALIGVTATGASCTVAAGNVISCTVGDVAPGDTVTLTVSGGVPAGFTGPLANTATVTSPTDTTPGNNTSTSTGPATPSADVRINKTRTSGPVVPGTRTTWQLRVVNVGPSTARSVSVSDDVLDALTGVTATGPAGVSCTVGAGNLVSCSVGDLAPTDPPVLISVSGGVPAGFTGTLSNTGQVASPTSDPDPSNNTSTDDGVVAPSAAVSVAKARTSGPVVPGTQVTWVVTATNGGPSVARSVRIDDDLIDAFTRVTATLPDGSTCPVAAGNVVGCELGDLLPGTSADVTITALVPAGYTGSADNTATVTSPTDTSTGDDTATVPGTAVPAADVSVVKTRPSGPVVPGLPVTWQIVVANAGPSVARTVTVADDVDDAITGLTATAPCAIAAGNQVSCALGDLAPGDTVTLTLTGGVPAGFTGPLANTATVASPTDITQGNNSSTSTGTAAPSADITVSKARTSGPVVPGTPVTWLIEVLNNGPSVAGSVTLSDNLDDALTAVTATGAGAVCTVAAGNQVDCTLGDLAPGQTRQVTISADVPAGFTGALDNTVQVSSPTDTTPANNTATSPGTANSISDVSITKARTSGPVVPGQPVTWTLRVTNAGPSNAATVTVADDVNPAFTGVTAAPVPAKNGCTVSPANAVRCDLGTLTPGETVVITVQAQVPPGYTGSADNTATVDAPSDTNPTNNTSSTGGAATPVADVSVVKTRTSGPVIPGTRVAWDVTVANAGPSTATNVQVTDDLVDALTGVTATVSGNTCAVAAGNVVTCALGTLPPGSPLTIKISADVPPGFTGDVDNTATVTSPTDSTPGNNSSTVPGPTTPTVDVSVVKTLVTSPLVAGGDVHWRLVVANAGPSTATSVVLTDAVPSGIGNVAATGPAGVTCTVTGNSVRCTLPDLGPADSVTIDVTGRLGPAERGTLTNTAGVVSGGTDTQPNNNTSTATTPITAVADLSVTKEISGPKPVPGGPITFTITVRNEGPSSATNVTLNDPIDSRVTDVAVTATAGTCVVDPAHAVICQFPELAPRAEAVVTVSGQLPRDLSSPVSNTATVTPGPETDPDVEDEVATVTTGPVDGADLQITKKASSSHAAPGDRITYSITVDNLGPGTALDVVVTDKVPDGLVDVTADAGSGTCKVTRVVTCQVGDLAAGQRARVTVRGTIAAHATGKVVNVAEVDSATADPHPGNNAGTAPVTVSQSPDDGAGPDDDSGPDHGSLPDTGLGAGAELLLLGGLLTILAGLGVLLASRRRRTTS